MAVRKLLSKRLFDVYRTTSPVPENLSISSPISKQHTVQQNAAKIYFNGDHMKASKTCEKGFVRRFIHRRAINQLPEFFSIPVGEGLRGTLYLDHPLAPPVRKSDPNSFGISVQEARKLLQISQMEKLKLRLKRIPDTSIPYFQFVQICIEECGNNDHGVEFAKVLDQCGNVIVLGNIVFLRPHEVAKSVENIISQSMATLDDPRRKQLEEMEQEKALIDKKAQAQVRGELYCGLGFLMVQTIGFMRLTFWELSWDVMEPICFFVTSLHFALAYGFFLRTSVEPSFEGFFQRRFKAKQKKLMKTQNFDTQKYNELRKVFYPDLSHDFSHSQCHKVTNREGESFLWSTHN